VNKFENVKNKNKNRAG